jgi:hypothetical protein
MDIQCNCLQGHAWGIKHNYPLCGKAMFCANSLVTTISSSSWIGDRKKGAGCPPPCPGNVLEEVRLFECLAQRNGSFVPDRRMTPGHAR